MHFSDENRTQIFYMVCIPFRVSICFFLTLVLKEINSNAVRYAAFSYLMLTAVGFIFSLILELVGIKKLGGFGGKIWWAKLRYVHILIYITTAILVYLKVQFAALLLLLDISFGILGKCFLS